VEGWEYGYLKLPIDKNFRVGRTSGWTVGLVGRKRLRGKGGQKAPRGAFQGHCHPLHGDRGRQQNDLLAGKKITTPDREEEREKVDSSSR